MKKMFSNLTRNCLVRNYTFFVQHFLMKLPRLFAFCFLEQLTLGHPGFTKFSNKRNLTAKKLLYTKSKSDITNYYNQIFMQIIF